MKRRQADSHYDKGRHDPRLIASLIGSGLIGLVSQPHNTSHNTN